MARHSKNVNLETVVCPLCGGNNVAPFLQVAELLVSEITTVWHLRRCAECDLIYLNPRPTEVASSAYYKNLEYLPFSSTIGNQTALTRLYGGLRRYNLKWKRRRITSVHQKGRLLDVGCGTGEFLSEMRNAGWEVAGIERDNEASKFARHKLRLEVISGGAEAIKEIHGKFDIITLWHVLEHLYQPKAALESLAQRLGDGGMIVVAVPNIASNDFKFYRDNWVAVEAPRHVQHFSVKTLQALAATTGLDLVRWHQLPLDAFFNTLMSEVRISKQEGISRLWGLLWPLRALRSLLMAACSLLGGSRFFFSGTRGATIVAYLRKSSGDPKSRTGS